MLDQGHITPRPVPARRSRSGLGLRAPKHLTRVRQPYFVQYVRDQLRQKYGGKALQSGGLQVKTTIDPVLQNAAHAAMQNGARTSRTRPAAALVAIDPRTGEILAMQSSTDYSKSKYNLAVQSRRQAGSTFKSYGLLAAMVDDHIDPNNTDLPDGPARELPALPRRERPQRLLDGAERRAGHSRRAAALDRARAVGERGLRAAGDRHRRRERRQHGLQARHPEVGPPADHALGDPGRRRRLAARHDPRVLDDRRAGRPPAAARVHQGGALRRRSRS